MAKLSKKIGRLSAKYVQQSFKRATHPRDLKSNLRGCGVGHQLEDGKRTRNYGPSEGPGAGEESDQVGNKARGARQQDEILDLRFWIEETNTWTKRFGYEYWNPSPAIENLKSENRKWAGIFAIAVTFAFGGAVAQAQQPKKVARIGVLSSRLGPLPTREGAFRKGLA